MFFAKGHEDSSECLYFKFLLLSVMLVLDEKEEEEVFLRVPKYCPQKRLRRLDDGCCPTVKSANSVGTDFYNFASKKTRSGRNNFRRDFNTWRTGLLNCLNARSRGLTFRHRASCI